VKNPAKPDRIVTVSPSCDAAEMSDDQRNDAPHYGTAAPDTPITRGDFERAIRFLNMSDLDIRENLLRLAAQVVTLTDELTRRIDGVEPEPAPPNTPSQPPAGTIERSVMQGVRDTHVKILAGEVSAMRDRVWLQSDATDKYAEPGPEIPCAELLPLCLARCCTMAFPLQTADLDEGVIRWDYGRPYMIRQRASDGYCVHNDPASRGCTVHDKRPLTCRRYDCRDDRRVWIDYDKRIAAPLETKEELQPTLDVLDRLRKREVAYMAESQAVSNSFPDAEPRTGPAPAASWRMHRPR
jgi:Fe-S-cluster containining protein